MNDEKLKEIIKEQEKISELKHYCETEEQIISIDDILEAVEERDKRINKIKKIGKKYTKKNPRISYIIFEKFIDDENMRIEALKRLVKKFPSKENPSIYVNNYAFALVRLYNIEEPDEKYKRVARKLETNSKIYNFKDIHSSVSKLLNKWENNSYSN